MAVKCLKCGEVLFETGDLPDKEGHQSALSRTHPSLDRDEDGDQFLRCPHCSAKNVTETVYPAGSVPEFRVVRLKE